VAPFGSPAAGLTPAFLTHGSTRPTSRRARRSPLSRGSLDAFLVENYRFYAEGNRLYRGEITHEPWTLRAATVDLRANTLFEANGFDRPDGDPIVRYAEPIDVSADRIRSVC